MSVRVPPKRNDGLRRYGQWAGNQNGIKENVKMCIFEVGNKPSWVRKQCGQKRGHGPDGLYCRQHAKKVEE